MKRPNTRFAIAAVLAVLGTALGCFARGDWQLGVTALTGLVFGILAWFIRDQTKQSDD